ncbi:MULTISPECIES: 16S rRNA (adenine(1518)-N(6)/adenine(1519)-N(6))-dimethyltransferase RsmA [Candidatus Ichthyocystis]|uniref:Ribosomal RNA small subunit methyltransferase A n=1 Tax=Candidatus Ichthyocystis hellenicum TaxID=1561003 RepID=A0A0S4M2T0_9BURK|nr:MULTISPECIES: 16S rRNA (adenine(1518)-N(6)/adenine(1519)-N(6))-dimethyltransferase RsmA [Ichthyocystis]CUT17536.1 16S ribosomal RNA methyltransferase [Candidatus Ichthyocystis hellenicum]
MFRAKKKWGQNFLCDLGTIITITNAICPQREDHFLEIGPGLGALTKHLVDRAKSITAIEIDPDCVSLLRKTYPKVVVFNQNILSTNWSLLFRDKKRVVGNIPYYISSELLELFCNNHHYLVDVHIMLQKEVADRVLSKPGDKNFSRLSLFVQSYFDAEHIISIEPTCFSPVPSVKSSFIRLITKSKPTPINQTCYEIIKGAFSKRRKMIRNSLSSFFSDDDFIKMGINADKRAQQISRNEYEIMSSFYCQIGKKR